MSSTNRSNARSAHVSDYYVTPIDQIASFLEHFKQLEPDALNGMILDCCAGGDLFHEMSYPAALKMTGVDESRVDTMDIRPDSLAAVKADYLLASEIKGEYDMIITNPPFFLAREIIEKALDDVKDGGWVIMLLRLNFFGGKARKDFWQTNMPKYAFVHHKRMSFTDDGKTDSIEYMHCVWQKGWTTDSVHLRII